MKILSGYYWNKGCVLEKNQDSLVLQQYLTKVGNVLLAIVCDGIGGLAEGENASGYVSEQLVDWLHHEYRYYANKRNSRIKRSIYRQFYRINEALNQYASGRGIKLGTTVTMLLIQGNQYVVVHSGDSRLYSIRNNKSKQVTKDHNYKGSILCSCVGGGTNSRPDVWFGRVRKGDGYLLCTDGFHHYIQEKQLAKNFPSADITREEQIIKRLNEIGDRAIRKGESDNLSAIYILLK